MSSEKKKAEAVEITPLSNFSGAREQKPLERKLRMEHGYPLVSLPKKLFKALGLVFSAEVEFYVEVVDANPLRNEIKLRIKKKKKSPNQLVKRHSKSEG